MDADNKRGYNLRVMNRLKRLFGDAFIRNNIVFFCGSMLVAFFNYLFYPVLGRLMKIGDFGDVQAFISLTLIAGVFAGILQNVITNVVSNGLDEESRKTVAALKKAGLFFSVVIAFLIAAFGSRFAAFFRLGEWQLGLVLSAVIVLGVSTAANQAIIQGTRDFKALSIAGLISSAGRLVFSSVLVFMGLGVLGATGGIVLAQAGALAYAVIYARTKLGFSGAGKVKIGRNLAKELRYAFMVFAAMLSVTFMYSGDAIVVKKLFSAEAAGLYGGIATVGRIIFFAVGFVASVLFPSIKMNDERGENGRTLAKAALIAAAIGGAFSLTFTLFPGNIVDILVGSRYGGYAHLLPSVGLFLLLLSFANLLFFYLLALRDRFVYMAAIAGPLVTIILCAVNRATVDAIVADFLAGSASVLALLLGRTLIDLKIKMSRPLHILPLTGEEQYPSSPPTGRG